jgi:hypothetical protein
MSDETSVPYIAGAAPNFPACTFHSLVVMNDRPAADSAGHAATPIATAISSSSAGIISANAVMTTR